MKISNAPVTLSPRHSLFVRAMAHATGVTDIDELVEEMFFSLDPSNELECMSDGREKDHPLYSRIDEAIIACHMLGKDWEGFVTVAEGMKPFSAAA